MVQRSLFVKHQSATGYTVFPDLVDFHCRCGNMRSIEQAFTTCCCCIPLNVFSLRKLAIALFMILGVDIVINLALIIYYASENQEGGYGAPIYTTLVFRILLDMGGIAVTGVINFYKDTAGHRYSAVWLVYIFMMVVIQLVLLCVYSLSFPGGSVQRKVELNLGLAPTEIEPSSAFLVFVSIAQGCSNLAVFFVCIYCWRCIYIVYLTYHLDVHPLLKCVLKGDLQTLQTGIGLEVTSQTDKRAFVKSTDAVEKKINKRREHLKETAARRLNGDKMTMV